MTVGLRWRLVLGGADVCRGGDAIGSEKLVVDVEVQRGRNGWAAFDFEEGFARDDWR